MYLWGISSVGRAPALQAGGHGFESRILHQGLCVAKNKHSAESYLLLYHKWDFKKSFEFIVDKCSTLWYNMYIDKDGDSNLH